MGNFGQTEGSKEGRGAPNPHGSRPSGFLRLPVSKPGKTAFFLWLSSIMSFGAGAAFAAAGETGGESFLSGSPWLYLTILPAFGLGVLGGGTAAWAMVYRGERSVLTVVPLVFGVLVLIFAFGEIIGHE